MDGMKCPECNAVMVLLGEGGYGECTNDECRLKVKVDGCKVPDCDDLALQEADENHEMND